MQTKLFDIIFNEDEVTWKSMIYKLVKEEGMDPWDIDITELSHKFLEMLKELKKMDFRISGKAILAAAILLKIKSRHLVGEDFNHLNRLIAMTEDDEEFFDGLEQECIEEGNNINEETYGLTPRSPLPRKRKVSVYDLVDALQKALEVRKRRVNRLSMEPDMEIPEKPRDINEIIQEVYVRIRDYFVAQTSGKLMFSQILPENSNRDEKIGAFVPLLYLDSQRKIELSQEKHLSEIEIVMIDGKQKSI